MKELTKVEFNKRIHQVRDAERIFGHLTDHNVTLAYRIYRDIFEENGLPEALTYSKAGKFHVYSLKPYKRPKCPRCGKPLHLRYVGVPQGKQNKNGYKSCWECMEKDCWYEKYSTREVKWEIKQLKLKGES
jgi:hypothetical protein